MKSIEALVAELVAAPRPVLCLDTCIFLDVITTGNRGLTDLIEVHRRLSEIVLTTPDRVQLVVTSLVLREWIQRKGEVRDEATKWLTNTDRQILEIHGAWERLGRPLASPRPTYHDPDLVNRLTSLAESLLRGSTVLQENMACVMRALQRVKRRMRPSHNNHIKDSIHFQRQVHRVASGEAGQVGRDQVGPTPGGVGARPEVVLLVVVEVRSAVPGLGLRGGRRGWAEVDAVVLGAGDQRDVPQGAPTTSSPSTALTSSARFGPTSAAQLPWGR